MRRDYTLSELQARLAHPARLAFAEVRTLLALAPGGAQPPSGEPAPEQVEAPAPTQPSPVPRQAEGRSAPLPFGRGALAPAGRPVLRRREVPALSPSGQVGVVEAPSPEPVEAAPLGPGGSGALVGATAPRPPLWRLEGAPGAAQQAGLTQPGRSAAPPPGVRPAVHPPTLRGGGRPGSGWAGVELRSKEGPPSEPPPGRGLDAGWTQAEARGLRSEGPPQAVAPPQLLAPTAPAGVAPLPTGPDPAGQHLGWLSPEPSAPAPEVPAPAVSGERVSARPRPAAPGVQVGSAPEPALRLSSLPEPATRLASAGAAPGPGLTGERLAPSSPGAEVPAGGDLARPRLEAALPLARSTAPPNPPSLGAGSAPAGLVVGPEREPAPREPLAPPLAPEVRPGSAHPRGLPASAPGASPHDPGAAPLGVAALYPWAGAPPARAQGAPAPLDRQALEEALAEVLKEAARRHGVEGPW